MRILLWLALGPVSGPLAALAYNAAKRGRYGLSALYASGIVAFYIAAPYLLALETAFLLHHKH